jgi:hypothetical protein
MFKYGNVMFIPMSRIALAGLMVAACTLQPRHDPPHDIALRIKAVASQHNASVHRAGGQTIYEIDAYRVPRGYRTTLTLIEGLRRDAVTATIFENDDADHHRLTVLVDEPLDGQLDYWMTARARTPNAAWHAIRGGRGQLSHTMGEMQPIYDQLVRELREEVPLHGVR